MTAITERRHSGGYLVSEAGQRSRDQVTLKQQSEILEAGTVLGKIVTGAQSVAAAVGFPINAVGVGALGALTADPGAMAGDWKVVIIEPAANAGKFEVIRPDGTLDGTGNVGVAYNGGINFTLADGGTDFSSGEGFTITVSYAAGSGKYTPWDPAAADGSQNACAILYNETDATGGDQLSTVHVRECEVNGSELVYDEDATADEIAAANAQLLALGIVVR
jgi:hypothetical protein